MSDRKVLGWGNLEITKKYDNGVADLRWETYEIVVYCNIGELFPYARYPGPRKQKKKTVSLWLMAEINPAPFCCDKITGFDSRMMNRRLS